MAAATATSWVVTIQDERIENKARITKCKLALATTDTYTTNGIPVPSAAALGMRRNLSYLTPYSTDPGLARIWKYDVANGSMRVFTASDGAELATTVTIGTAADLYVEAVGW